MRLARWQHTDREADSRGGEERPATGGHTGDGDGTTAVSGPRMVFPEPGAGAVGFPQGKTQARAKASHPTKTVLPEAGRGSNVEGKNAKKKSSQK